MNRRVDGVVHFDVDIMTHQGFTGTGKVLDIGLAPDGRSVAKVEVPDLECGPKPAKCHARVGIDLDTDKLPGGLQSLRFRYNNTDHPNGDRQFAGTEWPLFVRSEPSELGQVGGKSWFTDVDYANVRIDHGLPVGPQRGTITLDFYSKGDHVQAVSTHVDARFGDDDEGTIVDRRSGEYRGPVSIDTTRFTNGWHCLALRADASRGDGGVSTGVLEVPLLINNPGAQSGNGTGSCFSM